MTTRNAQHPICVLLSILIVAAGLSLANYAAEHAANDGYSVTVTQLQ